MGDWMRGRHLNACRILKVVGNRRVALASIRDYSPGKIPSWRTFCAQIKGSICVIWLGCSCTTPRCKLHELQVCDLIKIAYRLKPHSWGVVLDLHVKQAELAKIFKLNCVPRMCTAFRHTQRSFHLAFKKISFKLIKRFSHNCALCGSWWRWRAECRARKNAKTWIIIPAPHRPHFQVLADLPAPPPTAHRPRTRFTF